jgi:hypothetical protein
MLASEYLRPSAGSIVGMLMGVNRPPVPQKMRPTVLCDLSILVRMLLGALPDSTVTVRLEGCDVRVRASQNVINDVSRIGMPVYLLDTAITENKPDDRPA